MFLPGIEAARIGKFLVPGGCQKRGPPPRDQAAADDCTLVHLLTDPIEFADVVILNKVADAEHGQLDAARKIIRSLSADAKIIETNHSDVAAEASQDEGLESPQLRP
ncbi:hypothetical protein [Acidiphilium sp.]|uniref:hypothetical protein n=1 Tax=Acidiphilium sp. TaxID=527 RepID=UPI003CFCAC91